MNQLPKFVTGRLTEPGGQSLVHPDADLLTAFLEQKVTRSEREQVFAHLSQCSACREVVALAAPESVVTASIASSLRGERTWLQWPGMRWAAVAAASVAVVAIGIALRPTLTEKGPSRATTEVVLKNNESSAAPLADQTRTAEASSTTGASESETESAAASPAKKSETARNEIASSKSRIAEARGDRKIAPAPAAKPTFEKDAQSAHADEKKQIPAVSQTAEVTAESPSVPPSAAGPRAHGSGVAGGIGVAGVMGGLAASTPRADRDQVAQNQSFDAHGTAQQRKFVIQPQQQAQTQAYVVQQPPDASKGNVAPPPGPPLPPTAGSLPVTVVAGNAQVPLEDKKEAVAGPLTLETRRTGKQKVLPNLRASGFGGPFNGGTMKVSAGQAVSWRISSEGKLLRKSGDQNSWQPVELPSAATLHSLASNNLDVWVGGAPLGGETAGALFHTTDGGEHWQRIYGPWTGDILALQSSSANSSVTVRTAEGEWQSQDVGQNWIRTR